MRIGIDLTPLQPPFTGVSNYEFWLVTALLACNANLEFDGFGNLQWQAVDQAFLDVCAVDALKTSASKAAGNSGASRVGRGVLKHVLRRSPAAHALAATVRAQVYRSSVAQRRVDMFHAFTYRAPSLRSPVPVIPVVHDLSHVRHPEMHPPTRIRWMRAVEEVCRSAPVIHTVSQFSASEVEAVFGISATHIHVIPPAVAPIFIREGIDEDASILAAYRLRAGGYALTVSTLEPRKNLKTLLRAYSGLAPSERQVMPLLVVGPKGWGNLGLDGDVAALVAAGDIRFTGYVSDPELATLYRGARIMLYPSIYEGFGMPVIEALACGAWVVASDAASLPEAIGAAGRLTPPFDVGAWRERLREVLDFDGARDSPAARDARKRQATAWTWTDAAARTLKMYQEACSSARASGWTDSSWKPLAMP